MQTLARTTLKKRAASGLVVPGLVAGAGFHRREDAHQPLLLTALHDNLAHPSFFTNVAVAQMLDGKPRLFGQRLGVLTDLIPQRLRPAGIVKNTDALDPQITAHSIGIADTRDGAADHHPIQTGQLTANLGGVPLSEKLHDWPPKKGLASVYQTAQAA